MSTPSPHPGAVSDERLSDHVVTMYALHNSDELVRAIASELATSRNLLSTLRATVAALQAEIDEWRRNCLAADAHASDQHARAQALRADAGRYRWLRKGGGLSLGCLDISGGYVTGDKLDAAIDAALASVGKSGEGL
jgi:hypothetical protein